MDSSVTSRDHSSRLAGILAQEAAMPEKNGKAPSTLMKI